MCKMTSEGAIKVIVALIEKGMIELSVQKEAHRCGQENAKRMITDNEPINIAGLPEGEWPIRLKAWFDKNEIFAAIDSVYILKLYKFLTEGIESIDELQKKNSKLDLSYFNKR